MIVSHALGLIFLKTRKTAGTSIEIGLAPFCGPDDIITRDTPADQSIRDALGYRGPQHEYGIGLRHYELADWRRLLLKGRRARFKNHMPALRLKEIVGEQVWRSYYKVCVERNPWDKAVSLYYWRTRGSIPRPTLHDFLESVSRRSLSNYAIYADPRTDELLVDHVMRYESLDQEMEALRQRLGLLQRITLPRAKGSHRPPRTPYAVLLGGPERALVEAACAREIARFGYRFEDSVEDRQH